MDDANSGVTLEPEYQPKLATHVIAATQAGYPILVGNCPHCHSQMAVNGPGTASCWRCLKPIRYEQPAGTVAATPPPSPLVAQR